MRERPCSESRVPTWQFQVLIVLGITLAATPWIYISYSYHNEPGRLGDLNLLSIRASVKKDIDTRITALSEKVEQDRAEALLQTTERIDSLATEVHQTKRAVKLLQEGAGLRATDLDSVDKDGGGSGGRPASLRTGRDRSNAAFAESAAAAGLLETQPAGVAPVGGGAKPPAIVTAITSMSQDYIASALVLQESVRSHGGNFKFEYVVIVPEPKNGPMPLTDPGWAPLVERGWQIVAAPMPVEVEDIKGPLKHSIVKSGCCGPSELIKLRLFRLEQFSRVLFFDADALVLGPLDDLVNTDETLWTEDIGLGGGCINGGFLATTPSVKDYDGMVAAVLKGDFDNGGRAWGKSGIGYCYGGQTFQGVVPYYFLKVSKKKSRNLDVWAYNNMGKNSPKPGKDVPYHGEITGVRSVHFTWCQKPWKCHVQQTDVCLAFHARFWQDLRHARTRGPNGALDKLYDDHEKCNRRR